MKKVELKEGLVLCEGIACTDWLDAMSTCKDCPIENLYDQQANYLRLIDVAYYGQ